MKLVVIIYVSTFNYFADFHLQATIKMFIDQLLYASDSYCVTFIKKIITILDIREN